MAKKLTLRQQFDKELNKLLRMQKRAADDGAIIKLTAIPQPKRVRQSHIAAVKHAQHLSQGALDLIKSGKSASGTVDINFRSIGSSEDIKRGKRSGWHGNSHPNKMTNLTGWKVSEESRKAAAKKAAATRRAREAAMSASEREALRAKRAAQFRQNVAGKTKPPKLSPEARKAAAKKAAATRRAREAAMSASEREELRAKRAAQARKNFASQARETSSEYFFPNYDDMAFRNMLDKLEFYSKVAGLEVPLGNLLNPKTDDKGYDDLSEANINVLIDAYLSAIDRVGVGAVVDAVANNAYLDELLWKAIYAYPEPDVTGEMRAPYLIAVIDALNKLGSNDQMSMSLEEFNSLFVDPDSGEVSEEGLRYMDEYAQ